MAKERTVNPAEAQRKKEKAAQLKKAKTERLAQRTDRLSKRSPARVERQIQEIQEVEARLGKLPSHEQRRLEELKKDLELIRAAHKKLGLGTDGLEDSEDRGSEGRGSKNNKDIKDRRDPYSNRRARKSIYWDPILNPDGNPPPGYQYIERSYDSDSGYSTSESVSSIPLPDGPPPRGGSEVVISKTVYEAAPVLRDFAKESLVMVPSVIRHRKKPKLDQENDDEEGEDSDERDKSGKLQSQYAPEEEELLREQGQWPEEDII